MRNNYFFGIYKYIRYIYKMSTGIVEIEIKIITYSKSINSSSSSSSAEFDVTQISPTVDSTVRMRSQITFFQDANPPIWSGGVQKSGQQTVFSCTFRSIADISNNEVDTSIQFGSPNPPPPSIVSTCRLDPRNSRNEIIRIGGREFTLITTNPNEFTFQNTNLRFTCIKDKDLFNITYLRSSSISSELNGLVSALVGSTYNYYKDSPTEDQDLMAAHLAFILGQFPRLYP